MNLENIKAVYIDDEPVNLMLLQAYAAEFNLSITTFENPLEGLDYALKNDIDILYTDYMMPEIDGIELIKRFRKEHKEIPIVVITAVGDVQEVKLNALEAGATDFLSKPIDIAEFKARSLNLISLREAQLKLKDKALHLESEVAHATKEILNREHETLMVLGRAAEYKDEETSNHTTRVAHYSKILANEYGLDEKMQEIIFYSSPFHDIGKVGIPDNILLKESFLDEEETKIMRSHAFIGKEILKDTQSPYLIEGEKIAYNHHEKFDGTGYPNGKKGDEIPISARIVSITDVFDALTSKRPYKNPWSFEEASDFLISQKGKHFDPILVDLFLNSIDKIRKIYDDLYE
ncbi:HD domain-containing phosphohydrolase [Halarcobacter sp.]|uniref:HD domain-containing phosphohydrolase n=1 Tax=Halarcobacter sp. TaxID=2321133 RepID=UPI002AAC2C13|nr:HD domain-containing phosphohydrolase [Halarcobacter sp.]